MNKNNGAARPTTDELKGVGELILERTRIGLVRAGIAPHILQKVVIEPSSLGWMDNEVKDYVAKLTGFVLAGLRHTREVEGVRYRDYPIDWWEHLKQQWFPLWALRRWPVKVREIEIRFTNVHRHYHVCPHLPVDDLHQEASRERSIHLAFLNSPCVVEHPQSQEA